MVYWDCFSLFLGEDNTFLFSKSASFNKNGSYQPGQVVHTCNPNTPEG